MRFSTDARSDAFLLELQDGETARDALDQALALLKLMPELWSLDWIVKAPTVPHDASAEQIAELARAYVRPENPATTLLVSGDRFLHLWARAMDFQFPRRRHIVVRSIDEARNHLRSRRETTDPGEPPVEAI